MDPKTSSKNNTNVINISYLKSGIFFNETLKNGLPPTKIKK